MERQKKKGLVGSVRPAFTLVELLVVITIIGMLMALLMPAISAARERGRCLSCLNQQKQLATALSGYESSHSGFPGWRNNVTQPGASAPIVVTWVGMLLPYIDRNDLWQKIKTNGFVFPAPTATTALPLALKLLSCPSDPPLSTSGGPSAYVANGLILGDPLQSLPPRTLDYVSANDGSANTLLVSEVTQTPPSYATSPTAKAHNWYDVDATGASPWQIKQTFGFPITGAAYSSALAGFATPYGSLFASYNNNTMTANINSAHSGGCNVVFADQHGIFLKDDAGINLATGSPTVTVYQILATPDGSKLNPTVEPPADEGQW